MRSTKMRILAITAWTAALAALAAADRTGERPAPVPPASRPERTAQVMPPGHPPATNPADAVPPVPEGSGTGPTGLTWTVPRDWKAEAPSSSMRRAQYRVPGLAGDAECVVFYFGLGQGGDAASNAERWASQFRRPEGGASPMKTREIDVGGLKVTVVEVRGTYSGGMGAAPGDRPGYQLLGAIATGPDADWFLKLTGPEETVGAQRAAFEGLIGSLTKGS